MTAIRLILRRLSGASEAMYGVSDPCFCVIAQGSKIVRLGNEQFQYDPAHYLIATAELPVVSQVTVASQEKPYLSLRLDLDPALIGSVMVEAGRIAPQRRTDIKAIDVSPLEPGLLDAVVRLVRLTDEPEDARFLMPLVSREIIYRLLAGALGRAAPASRGSRWLSPLHRSGDRTPSRALRSATTHRGPRS